MKRKIFCSLLVILCIVMCLFIASCDGSDAGKENAVADSQGPHTHSFGEWVVIVEPSCYEMGVREQSCYCGETNRDKIPVKHDEEVIYGYAPTCEAPGLTDGKKCRLCNEVIEDQTELPPSHTEEIVPGYDYTCTKAGLTDGKKCAACGIILLPQESIPASHREEDVAGKAATCKEDGLTDGKKCTACGVFTVKQTAIPAKGHTYTNGVCSDCGVKEPSYTRNENTVYFGSYPQSEVRVDAMKTTLNAKLSGMPTKENPNGWTDYGYYANGEKDSFMWYIDVMENGVKYRGVYFTQYRSQDINYEGSENVTYQDDNGFYTGNVYWFKFEPIAWTILKEEDGKALIVCNLMIDAQNISLGGEKANNYAASTVRAWLNDNFYNTAFSDIQKEIIVTTTVDNSVASTGYSDYNDYACENTEDKVFLLSANEAQAYFKQSARIKQVTTYAKIQGVGSPDAQGYVVSAWWLRSAARSDASYVKHVTSDGYIEFDVARSTYGGIVPAIVIELAE